MVLKIMTIITTTKLMMTMIATCVTYHHARTLQLTERGQALVSSYMYLYSTRHHRARRFISPSGSDCALCNGLMVALTVLQRYASES